jgi:hypothetical protein
MVQQMAAHNFQRNFKNEMFSAENDGVAEKIVVSSLNIMSV